MRKELAMSRNPIPTVSILLLLSCGSYRSTLLNLKKEENSKVRVSAGQVKAQLKQATLIYTTDTNELAYNLEIKPIGQFSFSIDKGFMQ